MSSVVRMSRTESPINRGSKRLQRIKAVSPSHAALSQRDDRRSPVRERHDARPEHKQGHLQPRLGQFANQIGVAGMPDDGGWREESAGLLQRIQKRQNAWRDHHRQEDERREQQLRDRIIQRCEAVLFQSSNDAPKTRLPAHGQKFVGHLKVALSAVAFDELSELHVIKNIQSNRLMASELAIKAASTRLNAPTPAYDRGKRVRIRCSCMPVAKASPKNVTMMFSARLPGASLAADTCAAEHSSGSAARRSARLVVQTECHRP